jgi:hypothetical protein
VMIVGKQIGLDGGALLHGWCQRTKSGQRNFTNRRGPRFFEVPYRSFLAGLCIRHFIFLM